ncbi:MAG TPA: TonB-dependent receptor [Thermoanaerobaculia bacterium]|jgi:vitamin B12 transporter
MKSLSLFLATAVLIFSTTVHAQTAPAVNEEIVVTASALPETIASTPAAVTVITREEIEQREARDVADVLREVPGVTIARTGSPGKVATLFVRGGSSKQALVLWNGIEMNNPYFSGYNFGQLSTAAVERVEVVRGPFSALYGSEAVSGVVNVLTTPSTSNLRADVEAGQQGLYNGAVSGAYVNGPWTAHVAVEQRRDDGFDPNDDFDGTSILGGAQYALFDGLSVGLMARHNRYGLGIPFVPNGSGTAFVPSLDRREEGTESQFAVPVRYGRGAAGYELRLSESRRGEDFSDPNGPFGPEQSTTDSRVRQAHATARYKTASFGAITIGGEWERAIVDNENSFSTIHQEKRTSRSFFIEDRLSLPIGTGSLEVAAGLRHDDYESIGSELSPRLGVAFVRAGHKFRVAYGEAFRAPAVGELYSPFFGNEGLDPERSRNAEIGYERFMPHGSISATLFRSEYEGLIVFGATRYENIAAADSQGLELGATRRFGNATVTGSYTWIDTEDEATGEPLLRRPEHSGSIAFGYDFNPFAVHLALLHNGSRDDVTDLFPYGRVSNDAYTTADIMFRWNVGAFAPYVKVENATDEQYEEVFGYESGGRRAIVGVRYTLR